MMEPHIKVKLMMAEPASIDSIIAAIVSVVSELDVICETAQQKND